MTDKTAYISFSAEINVTTAEHLLGTVFDQLSQGASEVYILFSSSGGFVDPGIVLFNTLKGLNVPLTIHNVGNVDSTGNAVFMAGHRRVACMHSTFMFHGTRWTMFQNQQVSRREIDEIRDNLGAAEAKIAGIVSDQTSLSLEEVNGFFIQAQTINSSAALAKGLVEEIRDVEIPEGVTPIQLVFNR